MPPENVTSERLTWPAESQWAHLWEILFLLHSSSSICSDEQSILQVITVQSKGRRQNTFFFFKLEFNTGAQDLFTS